MKNKISRQTLLLTFSVIATSGLGGYFTTHRNDTFDSVSAQENDQKIAGLSAADQRRRSTREITKRSARITDRDAKRMTSVNLDGLDALTRAKIIAAGVAGLNSQESFEAALKQFQNFSGLERNFAFNLLFAEWAKIDPALAMDAVIANKELFSEGSSGPFSENFVARVAVMRAWSQSDPFAASDYLLNQASNVTFFQSKLAELAAEGLARLDPNQAIKWARAMDEKNSEISGKTLAFVFQTLTAESPERAISLFGDTFSAMPKQGRLSVVKMMANRLTSLDPELLEQFLASIPDSEDRTFEGLTLSELANNEATYAMIYTDVEEALRRFTEIRRDQEKADAFRMSKMLVEADFDRAKSWVNELEIGEGFAQALGPVVWELSKQDRDQAYDYVSTFTDKTKREQAISYYIQDNLAKDFRRTAELSTEIENNLAGIRARDLFLTRWYVEEPQNAANFINENFIAKPKLVERLNKLFAEE